MRCIFLLCLTSYLACIKLLKAHNNKWLFITLYLGGERKAIRYRQLHMAAVWFSWWLGRCLGLAQTHFTLANPCVWRERRKAYSVCVCMCVALQWASQRAHLWHSPCHGLQAFCSTLTILRFHCSALSKSIPLCVSLPYISNYSLLWFILYHESFLLLFLLEGANNFPIAKIMSSVSTELRPMQVGADNPCCLLACDINRFWKGEAGSAAGDKDSIGNSARMKWWCCMAENFLLKQILAVKWWEFTSIAWHLL